MARTPRKTHSRSTGHKPDAAHLITDEIVTLLEKGTLPWRRPWRMAGAACLCATGARATGGSTRSCSACARR
nr:ArdC family protein [Jannaschia formosa]